MPDVSWDGQSCAADCISNPKGCGLTSRGYKGQCVRYWKRKVETCADGRAGDVDRHFEEDWDRDVVSEERAGAQQNFERQRDRLYPAGFASSSLNFSDFRLTKMYVLHYCRLGIHRSGGEEG